MRKPTQWSDDWNSLPILGIPSIKGWELYEALRERAKFIYGTEWETGENTPASMIAIAKEFNPNRDHKEIEMAMHQAISDLLPLFVNIASENDLLWTMDDALAYLGATERLKPNPYYLSANWLWQSYKLVNLMKRKNGVISISWIDEAEPVYTDGDYYNADKTDFQQSIPFNVAVIQPGGSDSGDIFGNSGRPSNVIKYNCDRDPCHNMSPFVSAFNALRAQYTNRSLTVGLFVDTSGSMNKKTISPAYENFVSYIRENYPDFEIIQRSAGNERWLSWTKQYIQELKFNFDADIPENDTASDEK